MAGKCNTAIDRNEITPILSRAVEYGDAKRKSKFLFLLASAK